MKQRITTLILLAGLVTMLAGCSEMFNGKHSGEMNITVSAINGPATKTAYTGDFVPEGGKLYERIKWADNDKIRVYSTNKTQVGVGVVTHASDIVDHYDYSILVESITNNTGERRSNASVVKPAEGTSLTWINDPYHVTFYGTYPPLDATYNTDESLLAFTGMTIDQNQTTTPNMSQAYMLAVPAEFNPSDQTDEFGTKIPKMHMDFYPVFNAFYIVLGSLSGEIEVNAIELNTRTEGGYLSGSYSYSVNQLASGPVVNGVNYVDGLSNSVKVTLPSGTKIKPGVNGAVGDSVRVTLLTLPPQTGTGLTNMVLNVYYNGETKPASLPLSYKGHTAENPNWIDFPAFTKSRITGLAMEGNKWKLTITTDVNDWTFYSKELSSLDQINVAPINPNDPDDKHTVDVTGGIETTNDWMTTEGYTLNGKTSSNHYLAAQGYDKYYQIRTLNWALPANKQYFEMSFTPTAPVGGYWMMVPEYVTPESEGHFRFEVVTQGVTSWENPGTQLKGQILGTKKVYIRIYPVNYGQEDINTYEMTLKCYFSPNVNFDPTYSSDSELQDIHGDGRFSYWRFRLTKYTGGPYAPGDPEHNSDKD
jgi:hypothetical protein